MTGVGSVRIAIGRMLAWRRPGPWRWWTIAAALALGVVPVVLFRYLPRLWAWIAVATIVAIVLGWVPLFGVLGLELALVSALFAAVMGADVGRAFSRELQTANVEGIERAVWPGRAIASGALLAVFSDGELERHAAKLAHLQRLDLRGTNVYYLSGLDHILVTGNRPGQVIERDRYPDVYDDEDDEDEDEEEIDDEEQDAEADEPESEDEDDDGAPPEVEFDD